MPSKLVAEALVAAVGRVVSLAAAATLSPLGAVPQLAASKRGDKPASIMDGLRMLFGAPESQSDTGPSASPLVTPLVAGVDEAGRGPLAGPVVAAALVLCKPSVGERLTGIDDSKKLSPKRRARLEPIIRETCAFGIGVVEAAEIDELNIFAATMLAMTRATALLEKALQEAGHRALEGAIIDGNMTPQGRCDGWHWPARAIVGGDGQEPAISAASILAKEHRDRVMREAAARYPHYGWERNMGYGTKEHMAALQEHGPCDLHRRSFAPVARAADAKMQDK